MSKFVIAFDYNISLKFRNTLFEDKENLFVVFLKEFSEILQLVAPF